MGRKRILLITAGVLAVLFLGYLFTLYRQLEQSFALQEQSIPTRIYSDVSRIAPPEPRYRVLERLKALGYSTKDTDQILTFQLHSIDYPTYLIPDGHPMIDASNSSTGSIVTLQFEGPEKDAALQSIKIGDSEVHDVYLEPEIVATLSRGGIEGKKQIRSLIKFEDIPAPLWKAIIAIEDQHFLEHYGLDPRGIVRAFLVNLRSLRIAQGGSTITQQLVKNLMSRHGRNFFKKVNELFLAVLLEVKFSKEQILERYLNEVYLGQIGGLEIHGVEEGAEHFFDKRLEDLNLAEMAMMAGLIRGPEFYSPYRHKERALERARLVLRKMVETGELAEGEAKAALKLPIRLAPVQVASNKAPYYVDFVKAELLRQLKDKMSEEEVTGAGFRIYTTLDTQLNTAAQNAVAQGLVKIEKAQKIPPAQLEANRLEGALASVDQNTGYIRALVGGRSYSHSNFNRILNMKRQVGSTFKPFVYLAALEKGTDSKGIPYGSVYPVEDAPWSLSYDKGRQQWAPRNYDKESMGWISMRTALAHSINTVAARLGWEVGLANVINTARQLGIESDLPEFPSLSLGVAELSPVELLRAYATLANHGVQEELTVIRGITKDDGTGKARFVFNPKVILDAGLADMITDLLTSVFLEGTAFEAPKLGFNRPAAGKTGTTSNYRDSWFAGYTPQLTTVVWVGLDHPLSLDPKNKLKLKLTGANSALPIWASYMKAALAGEPPLPFPASSHLISVRIDRHSGKAATSDCPEMQVIIDKYLEDHEPKDSACEPDWPPSEPTTED